MSVSGFLRARCAGALAWSFLATSSVWVVLVLAAPLAASGHGGAACPFTVATYAVGARVCHQRPDRSFHVNAIQLPVCARCSGLYLGAPVGAMCGLARRRSRNVRLAPAAGPARLRLAAFALPTLVTFVLEGVGLAVSGAARATAGAVLSAGASWLVVAALAGERSTGEVD